MKQVILAATAALLVAQSPAQAQDVTLKVHHFLPAGSAANTMFIMPWCDKIAKESANKLKCQIYPSMQLGGTPPQLYDQARTASPTSSGRCPATPPAASRWSRCSSCRS